MAIGPALASMYVCVSINVNCEVNVEMGCMLFRKIIASCKPNSLRSEFNIAEV